MILSTSVSLHLRMQTECIIFKCQKFNWWSNLKLFSIPAKVIKCRKPWIMDSYSWTLRQIEPRSLDNIGDSCTNVFAAYRKMFKSLVLLRDTTLLIMREGRMLLTCCSWDLPVVQGSNMQLFGSQVCLLLKETLGCCWMLAHFVFCKWHLSFSTKYMYCCLLHILHCYLSHTPLFTRILTVSGNWI